MCWPYTLLATCGSTEDSSAVLAEADGNARRINPPGLEEMTDMGLIHTRASKKRDRAQAALLREQLREDKAKFAEDSPALRQPTVGLALAKMLRNRKDKQETDR